MCAARLFRRVFPRVPEQVGEDNCHEGGVATGANPISDIDRAPCCISSVAFVVAGRDFEPPTSGLCDLTHLFGESRTVLTCFGG